jgi:hypothetical protein
MDTKTLGSRSLATLIRSYVKEMTYELKWSRIDEWGMRAPVEKRVRSCIECDAIDNPPEGWEFLGEGWSRMAFLGPDGVVYKVAKDARASEWSSISTLSQNFKEHKVYKSRSQEFLDNGCRLAACRLLNNSVLAMEFVENCGMVPDMYTVAQRVGLSDAHSGNVWLDRNGIPTFIDYAA